MTQKLFTLKFDAMPNHTLHRLVYLKHILQIDCLSRAVELSKKGSAKKILLALTAAEKSTLKLCSDNVEIKTENGAGVRYFPKQYV